MPLLETEYEYTFDKLDKIQNASSIFFAKQRSEMSSRVFINLSCRLCATTFVGKIFKENTAFLFSKLRLGNKMIVNFSSTVFA